MSHTKFIEEGKGLERRPLPHAGFLTQELVDRCYNEGKHHSFAPYWVGPQYSGNCIVREQYILWRNGSWTEHATDADKAAILEHFNRHYGEQAEDHHADLKAQYEEDCKYSEKPWQWWEHKNKPTNHWIDIPDCDPVWGRFTDYRRKANAPVWLPEPEPLTKEEWEAHTALSKERRNGFYSEKGLLCSHYGRVLATIDKGWTPRDPEDTGSNAERQEFFRWLKDWRAQRSKQPEPEQIEQLYPELFEDLRDKIADLEADVSNQDSLIEHFQELVSKKESELVKVQGAWARRVKAMEMLERALEQATQIVEEGLKDE